MPRKEKIGKVVSNKMDKTIVVAIQEKKPHPKYGKILAHTIKFKAHDENNVCKIGDIVRIQESRPFSKEKRWAFIDVVEATKELTEKA